MNPPKQLQMVSRKDNLQNISQAFRKLFDKVSVRMHSANLKKNLARTSFSINKNQHFLKSRKNSVNISHRRKNSFFTQGCLDSPTKSIKTDHQSTDQQRVSQLRKGSIKYLCKSVGNKTHLSIPKSNDIYNKIASYNQLLITKMYFFQGANQHKTAKVLRQQKYKHRIITNDDRCQQKSCQRSNYQSKIKQGQKNKRIHATSKKQEIFAKLRQQRQMTQFEPWETDKAEEYFFAQ